MNIFDKTKLLFYSAIILLVVNVAAIGTIIYMGVGSKKSAPSHAGTGVSGPDTFREDQFLARELQLDSLQVKEFGLLRAAQKASLGGLLGKISQARGNLLDAMKSEPLDTMAIHTFAEEVGCLQGQLKAHSLLFLIHFKSVCRPEQQEKLNQMIEKALQRNEQDNGFGMGKGRQWRFRHGRNANTNQ